MDEGDTSKLVNVRKFNRQQYGQSLILLNWALQ